MLLDRCRVGDTATRRCAPDSSATKSTIGGCGSFLAAVATAGAVGIFAIDPIEVGGTLAGVCGVLIIGALGVSRLGVGRP